MADDDHTVVNAGSPLGLNPPAAGKVRDVRVAKQCVFCGLHPAERTKEHVLPLWLIELTGDPKREADFQLWNVTRKFSYDQFTARACKECNNEWGKLESQVKPVIEGLVAGSAVV